MVGRDEEIGDPYGGPLEGYIETADLLDKLITTGLPRILKRIGVTMNGEVEGNGGTSEPAKQ